MDSVQKDSTIYGDKYWTMIIKSIWINYLHNVRASTDLTILQVLVKIKYLAQKWNHNWKLKYLNLEIKMNMKLK